MADELVFYTNPMSRGRIVRWMLEEIGQPYRTELLDFATTMKAPDYLAINPMGKVPAIRHGDAVVTEGAAICAYLADAFPERRPRAAARRSASRAVLPLAVLRRRPGRGGGDQQGAGLRRPRGAREDVGLRRLADVMNALEALSRSATTCGDGFTAADVYLGSQIGLGLMFGTIEKRPAFERYWARQRAAGRRARETDRTTAWSPEKKAATAGQRGAPASERRDA